MNNANNTAAKRIDRHLAHVEAAACPLTAQQKLDNFIDYQDARAKCGLPLTDADIKMWRELAEAAKAVSL